MFQLIHNFPASIFRVQLGKALGVSAVEPLEQLKTSSLVGIDSDLL